MERISYSPETLFHVLTHFETADEALRDSLRRAGFTDEAIDATTHPSERADWRQTRS